MNRLTILIFIFCIASCKTANKQISANIKYPETWPVSGELSAGEKQINWWDNFYDPNLTSLINEALYKNSDIEIAQTNIAKAQAELNISDINSLPSLNTSIESQKGKNSKEIELASGKRMSNAALVGIRMNYQLDLWNKLSNASKAQKSLLKAAISTKDNIRLSVTSEVAISYFNFLNLVKQKKLTQEILNIEDELYSLKKIQYENGATDQEDLISSNINLNNIKKQIEDLEEQLIKQRNVIKILIGADPVNYLNEIKIEKEIESFVITPILPSILPSELVTKRPDIKAKEETLIASNISVDIARKYYLPDISLTGLLGLSSVKIDDIFSKSSGIWQIGANLASPLIDFGKNKNNLKLKEALAKKALIDYEKTIKIAFIEVYNALSAQEASFNSFKHIQKNLELQKTANNITHEKYKVGFISKLELLQGNKKLIQAKINIANAKTAELVSIVNLYKALGGPWN